MMEQRRGWPVGDEVQEQVHQDSLVISHFFFSLLVALFSLAVQLHETPGIQDLIFL